jgi:hypothetical protein
VFVFGYYGNTKCKKLVMLYQPGVVYYIWLKYDKGKTLDKKRGFKVADHVNGWGFGH